MCLSCVKTSNGSSLSDVSLSVSKESLSLCVSMLVDDGVGVSVVCGGSVTVTRLRLFGGSLFWVLGRLLRGFNGQRLWLVRE